MFHFNWLYKLENTMVCMSINFMFHFNWLYKLENTMVCMNINFMFHFNWLYKLIIFFFNNLTKYPSLWN